MIHCKKYSASIFICVVFLCFANCGGGNEPGTDREVIGGIAMIALPAGSFMMGHDYSGSRGSDDSVDTFYPDEQPVHMVTLHAFQIGETEITQAQYQALMGDNPSYYNGGDMLPVTDMGATKALEFCNRLSEKNGLDSCYDPKTGTCDFSKNGFRLPTEAEWEYACRAGTSTHFNTGDTVADLDRGGWFIGNSENTPHPVAQKEPNAWGLYDMHGNVWECCYDGYDEALPFGNYLSHPVTDPVGYDNFNYRIIRGGGWNSHATECRSAVRGAFWTGGGSNFIGFRVARSLR